MAEPRKLHDLLTGEMREELPPMDRAALQHDLAEVLTHIPLEDFIHLITNEFQMVLEYNELRKGGRGCQRMSLLFNPHRLTTRTSNSKLSIYDALRTESFISGLARACIFQHKKVNDLLYQTMQIGINGVQYVNEFPPHVARDIYKMFDLHKDSQILDPCAGWGGRMIGASIVSDHYHGFEPQTDTYRGLLGLSSQLKRFSKGFEGKVTKKPFEDGNLRPEFYDFALTSPPYYDTEIYSETEETNSLNRYKDFDSWCEGFYLPLIDNTMEALKPSSTFVLNIGSRRYPLNERLRDHAKGSGYTVEKLGNFLSGKGAGLGKSGEGETFYAIRKGN